MSSDSTSSPSSPSPSSPSPSSPSPASPGQRGEPTVREVRNGVGSPSAAETDLGWLRPIPTPSEPSAEPATEDGTQVTVQIPADELNTTDLISAEAGTRKVPDSATNATVRDGLLVGTPGNVKRIRHFEILSKLGSGAFGNVLLARDPRLDRLVAVKVAKVGAWASDEDRRRFLREARAAAQLRHPNIVPVYEFGTHEDSDFIAYQYIQGSTLRSRLAKQSKVSPREAAVLIRKIARALDYAHSKQIVHRDVKPENILIDEEGEPHVADFGCARREEGGALLTVDGQVMGTPAYMSPEQAAGQSYLADGRSDVWSLGIMLHEMLTGQRPFQGTVTEILVGIRDLEPKPIRVLDAKLPLDLETICQKSLAKSPADRFQTAGEMADELDRWLGGEPILSRRISLLARTWRWARRNRAIAALLAAIVLVTSSGAIISTALLLRARHEERQRVLGLADKLMQADAEHVSSILSDFSAEKRNDLIKGVLLPQWNSDSSTTTSMGQEAHSAEGTLAAFDARQTRLALGLVYVSPPIDVKEDLLRYLRHALLHAPSEEYTAIRKCLVTHDTELASFLWQVAQDPAVNAASRLRAACGLAQIDSQSTPWTQIRASVALQLLEELDSAWLQALIPVRALLQPELESLFRESNQKYAAAVAIRSLYSDDVPFLVRLLKIAEPAQIRAWVPVFASRPAALLEELQKQWEKSWEVLRQTDHKDQELSSAVYREGVNLAISLLAAGEGQPAAALLRQDLDPTPRSLLIEQLGPAGIEVTWVIQRMQSLGQIAEPAPGDPREISGWLLALGQYDPRDLLPAEIRETACWIRDLGRRHPDGAVHSAARWLLRQPIWSQDVDCPEPLVEAASPSGARNWRILQDGTTVVRLGPVESFAMGTPPRQLVRFYGASIVSLEDSEHYHQRQIPRQFELGIHEVTVEQFTRFELARIEQFESAIKTAKAQQKTEIASELEKLLKSARRKLKMSQSARASDSASSTLQPVSDVSWWDAAAYCRWLSELEGVEEGQMCFPDLMQLSSAKARYVELQLPKDLLQRTGFRLPTCGEWEWACRAGSQTPWHWGTLPDLGRAYSWSKQDARSGPQDVALRKPNLFGCFDLHGNLSEWSQSRFAPYPRDRPLLIDGETDAAPGDFPQVAVRGGSFEDELRDLRSARRGGVNAFRPETTHIGFRIARTVAIDTIDKVDHSKSASSASKD